MESKFRDLPDISTIQPETLIKYRVSEDRFSAEVLLPGLWYTDFDQKIGGKLSLWSLAKLFEGIRWQALKHGLMYYPELCHGTNRALFLASQAFTLSKEVHNICYPKDFDVRRPLRAIVYVSNIGTSSYTAIVELFDYKSEVKLASYITVGVSMDKTKRKPVPLPQEYFKGMDEHFHNIKITTIRKAKAPPMPLHAFKYEVKALHSDCDMNHHVNQATYIRWCSDAGALAARQGKLSSFPRHIELYPVKSTEFHYLGEAVVNDMVSVYVWEDKYVKRTLRFLVKLKEKTIFILQMDFHEGGPIKVSPHLLSQF